MRTAISNNATPSEKQDYIMQHLFNLENSGGIKINNRGGAKIDFINSFMSYDPKIFGLSSKEEMKFYLDTLEQAGMIELIRGTFNDFV
jgi:hypothetical protein